MQDICIDGEFIKWHPKAVVRKFDDYGNFIEEISTEGNLLLTAGLDLITKRMVIGTGYALMDNTSVRLGVGNDSATAVITDNDLSTTTSQLYRPLDGAPTQLNGAMTFIATFGVGDANFAWNCWGIDYKATAGSPAASATPNGLLNRKVFSFGTKSGGSWQLTVTLTLA